MKVNGMPPVGGINPYNRQQNLHAEQTGKTKKRKDEIEISSEAKEMLDAKAVQTEGRQQTIQDLQKSVQTGTYHVDARKIAEKMLPFIK
ncbi:MAG: flagellar biosynthesis anti-sigma factor FlgM [Paenibacillus sp. RIFOXYA1_FULL_44_5]|nr:MAG: flagellar biosynthesis anti-sigma factor FlgM [Paenibacillus sp. RIFOXYA1_FULL_44_5]